MSKMRIVFLKVDEPRTSSISSSSFSSIGSSVGISVIGASSGMGDTSSSGTCMPDFSFWGFNPK